MNNDLSINSINSKNCFTERFLFLPKYSEIKNMKTKSILKYN